ncbi:hypothetical protein D3C81_741520 [compost metagenome]
MADHACHLRLIPIAVLLLAQSAQGQQRKRQQQGGGRQQPERGAIEAFANFLAERGWQGLLGPALQQLGMFFDGDVIQCRLDALKQFLVFAPGKQVQLGRKAGVEHLQAQAVGKVASCHRTRSGFQADGCVGNASVHRSQCRPHAGVGQHRYCGMVLGQPRRIGASFNGGDPQCAGIGYPPRQALADAADEHARTAMKAARGRQAGAGQMRPIAGTLHQYKVSPSLADGPHRCEGAGKRHFNEGQAGMAGNERSIAMRQRLQQLGVGRVFGRRVQGRPRSYPDLAPSAPFAVLDVARRRAGKQGEQRHEHQFACTLQQRGHKASSCCRIAKISASLRSPSLRSAATFCVLTVLTLRCRCKAISETVSPSRTKRMTSRSFRLRVSQGVSSLHEGGIRQRPWATRTIASESSLRGSDLPTKPLIPASSRWLMIATELCPAKPSSVNRGSAWRRCWTSSAPLTSPGARVMSMIATSARHCCKARTKAWLSLWLATISKRLSLPR